MILHSTVTKNELKQHAIDMYKPQNQSWMKRNKQVAEDDLTFWHGLHKDT